MTSEQFKGLTVAQQKALWAIFKRPVHGEPAPYTWGEFIREAFPDPLMGCVMVPWAGMWLGVEKDGHTHS